MSQYWFKQKRFGYGASPSSWEGWALTIGYVAAITSASVALLPARPFAFVIIGVVLTGVFVFICWRKTEGGWRWRSGREQ